MTNRQIAQWIPPAIRDSLNRLIGATNRYKGPYRTWSEAVAASAGYESEHILARVVRATSLVLSGSARYERDGLAFTNEPIASHALAAVLLGAARSGGRLTVLDLGGGLATHYLQWLPFLRSLRELTWCVVEQPSYVEEGRRLFSEDPCIRFESNFGTAAALLPNVVLASSVFHYLEDPAGMLAAVIQLRADVCVIDRTPVSMGDAVTILTQHAPAKFGRASYPLWLLPGVAFREAFARDYDLIMEHSAADAPIRGERYYGVHRGFIWVAKSHDSNRGGHDASH